MENKELFRKYFAIRDELDRHCAELYQLHAPHLNCKAGCDSCCMDFSIFPVEFYAIKQQAGDNLKKGMNPAYKGDCPFLVNHRCVIYAARPMICRTQGLPLLYMGEEQWELSVCELNFKDFDFDKFTEKNTFPQDKYNSRLFLLNQKYTKSLKSKPYNTKDLLPLRQLLDLL